LKFSTFELIDLTQDSIMQRAEMPMLYDLASNQRLPCLYICPVANVLGCAPLISVFHRRQQSPLSPHDSAQPQGQSAFWKRLH
jgi:hypothetical protein